MIVMRLLYLLVVGGHGFPRLYTGKIAERLSQLHSAGLLYHYTLSSTELKKKYTYNVIRKYFLISKNT